MGRRRISHSAGVVPDTRLAQNRSGIWEIRWTEYDAGRGRAISRSHSCKTRDKDVAEQVRKTWVVASLQVQAVASGAVVSVEDVCRAYMADKGHGPGSSQDFALRPVLADLGSRAVGELSAEVLGKFRRDRAAAGVADGTVRRNLSALRAALAWGVRKRKLPADVVPDITLPPEGAPRERYLTEAEETAVWDAAKALAMDMGRPFRERRPGLFVCIALETAARESAIRGLTWDRVDFKRGLIDFRDPARAVTRKRRVPVPMSDRLRPVLEAAALAQAMEKDGALVHVLRHPGEVRKGFESFRRRVGVEFTIHDMRRTWASLRLQWGVPIGEVAGVLGDTVEVTERHYAHFCPDYLRSAVNVRGGGRAGQAGQAGGLAA